MRLVIILLLAIWMEQYHEVSGVTVTGDKNNMQTLMAYK